MIPVPGTPSAQTVFSMNFFSQKRASWARTTRAIATIFLLTASVPGANAMSVFRDDSEPLVAGWTENVWLTDQNVKLRAKLDTGAKSSSIHAEEIEAYARGEEQWVRFSIQSESGARMRIESPVARYASIKRAGTDTQKRIVIKLAICLGGHSKSTDFTLTNRTGMNYPILIGREFLSDKFLVSSTLEFQLDGRCSGQKNQHFKSGER